MFPDVGPSLTPEQIQTDIKVCFTFLFFFWVLKSEIIIVFKVGIRSAQYGATQRLSQRKIFCVWAYSKRFWIRPIHFFLCVSRTVRETLPPP